MNSSTEDSIKSLRSAISSFREKFVPVISQIHETSQRLRGACTKVQSSWSGSFAGWHGSMYYRDFEVPPFGVRFSSEWGGINGIPDGWEEKTPEVAQKKIEGLVGDNFSAKDFEEELKNLKKNSDILKNQIIDICSGLAIPEKDKTIVEAIENFKFGRTKAEYVSKNLPGSLMSRDTSALMQGTYIPTWLYYEGVAVEGQESADTTNEFLDLTERLAGRLGQKDLPRTPVMNTFSLSGLHPEIFAKCHGLYEHNAFSEAVEKSFKVVRDKLRTLTGYETGSDAFGKGKLFINGAAATNVEEDFNRAVQFLTMAIDRFRNEKSHTSDAKIDDPARAFEYLCLSSLAMRFLDDAKISP